MGCSPFPPVWSREALSVEARIGKGAFSSVFQVVCRPRSQEAFDTDGDDSTTCHSTTSSPYALKELNPTLLGDSEWTEKAVADLVNEAKILSSLPRHDHIVQLEGLSSSFWERPEKGFLLLELVAETLHDSLQRSRYRRTCEVLEEPEGHSPWQQRRERLILKAEQEKSRVQNFALGVASAMRFLHSKGIIYRDLKPTNVGIGFDGKIRLFDFGLARQLDHYEGGRRLTGSTGTARYMAPEVASNEDYNFSADVYSFAILLWEICTLKKPSVVLSSGRYSRFLPIGKSRRSRPPLRAVASKNVKSLLKVCWDPKPERRPPFAIIIDQLDPKFW